MALVGLGWLSCGVVLRRRGRPGLGWVTIILGCLALLGGIDRSILMLPWIPVPPSVPRILLELAWVPWAFGAAVAGRILAATKPDPLDDLVATLRH